MKRTILLAFFVGSLMVFNACETDTQKDKETPGTPEHAKETTEETHVAEPVEDDGKMMIESVDVGMREIEASKVAMEMGTNPEVKKLAKMMMDDHMKVNDQLKGVAMKKNIEMPTMMSTNNQEDIDDLRKKKKGKEFDEAYTNMMVKDHEEEIDDYKKRADKATDPELKSWYAGMIPGLEHHLMEAKRVHDMVK